MIKDIKLKHPKVIYAMYVMESGRGKSKLAQQDYNIFGMKYPYNRPTTAVGKTKSGFAKYKNTKDSVKDLKLWQDKYAKDKSKQSFLQYLRKVYAQEKNYLKKVLGY